MASGFTEPRTHPGGRRGRTGRLPPPSAATAPSPATAGARNSSSPGSALGGVRRPARTRFLPPSSKTTWRWAAPIEDKGNPSDGPSPFPQAVRHSAPRGGPQRLRPGLAPGACGRGHPRVGPRRRRRVAGVSPPQGLAHLQAPDPAAHALDGADRHQPRIRLPRPDDVGDRHVRVGHRRDPDRQDVDRRRHRRRRPRAHLGHVDHTRRLPRPSPRSGS